MLKASCVKPHSLFTDFDIFLFKEGKHYQLYDKLGAHIVKKGRTKGVYFAVYAPGASRVTVIGDFNDWDVDRCPLFVRWDQSGIWEGWIEGVEDHAKYKYCITNADTGERLEKIDPFAFGFEHPPHTASLVRNPNPKWSDAKWMNKRGGLDKPIATYEMHLGSWKKKKTKEGQRSLTYQECADELVPYVKEMGYTHVEFLPLTEHPFHLSWGYQSLGFFAPTSRYGSFEEFCYLVNALHKEGIGVILDFVPSHFPCDAHGLYRYDGTHVFEYYDPQKQIHPDWGSAVFNFERPFVRSFLISAIMFWVEKLHIDGFRIDAVASMLYLDYSRKEGQWSPNVFGGNQNLEAVEFIKILNEAVFAKYPNIHMIAEESTSWSGVSHPTYAGGLGFDMKWMMGWMHDVLQFFQVDPLYRQHHYGELIFSFLYFTHENFMLPLSHDEVAHGKGSIMSRMPGDYWQKFANLRLLYCYMYFHPGTKLSFMGNEIAQFSEWNINESLDWHLLEFESHTAFQTLIKDLNALYKSEPSLYKHQFSHDGLEWIVNDDNEQCVIAFVRKYKNQEIIVIGNFTPQVRENYRIGLSQAGSYVEILNSDDKKYFGSGVSSGIFKTQNVASHGKSYSIELTLPPLAFIAIKKQKVTRKSKK